MDGSQVFVLNCQNTKLCASKTEHSVDLSCIPEEYHEFAEVFSKAKADTLAPHRPYDLKINLEEGSNPPFGPIYSMSPSELQSLREFLDEHLNIGFIRPHVQLTAPQSSLSGRRMVHSDSVWTSKPLTR